MKLSTSPEWANEVISNNMPLIVDYCRNNAKELPVMYRRTHNGSMYAKTYGCGVLGCVYPTYDRNLVFKITIDMDEARFAIASIGIEHDGVVKYNKALRLIGKRKGRHSQVMGLWREASDNAGIIERRMVSGGVITDSEKRLYELSGLFFEYALIVGEARELAEKTSLSSFYKNIEHGLKQARDTIGSVWSIDDRYEIAKQMIAKGDDPVNYAIVCCENISKEIESIKEFSRIGSALTYFINKGIIISDINIGNFGEVNRGGKPQWVITDPGIAIFITSKFDRVFRKYGL